jgi:transmembrane sensor
MMPEQRSARETLIAEAAEWLAALDTGRADLDAFEAWRAADAGRAVAFAEVARNWQLVGNAGLDTTRHKAPEASMPAAIMPQRRHVLRGIAAGLAGVCAVGASYAIWHDPRKVITTSVGERRVVPLPDGSTAELNTNSRIAWAFSAVREVWLLEGEAAFTVLENLSLPFILHAGLASATLKAGRYNIRLRNSGPQFVALNGGGRIDLGADRSLSLLPNQAVIAEAGRLRNDPINISDARDMMAWQGGEIVFRGMTLYQAVDEFNRYLDRKIVIGDPAIGSIRLGGRFYFDDPSSFLAALHDGFGIKVGVSADRITLRAR